MGCGGYGNLFGMMDYYRGGCGSRERRQYEYSHNDFKEKLIFIKKMYAQGLLDDNEYEKYKEKIYSNDIIFDELIRIQKSKLYEKNKPIRESIGTSQTTNKVEDKINKLKEAKEKIINVQQKLLGSIKSFTDEKERMEGLAESALQLSEQSAEDYINKKIDIEQNIINLEQRNNELQNEADEIDRVVKNMETKALELESIKLQEQIAEYKNF